jgi:hypothetical protein
MVGKVVQGMIWCQDRFASLSLMHSTDILKLSDETDLDLLNNAMETMVKHYTAELLPVAAQLTARLVSGDGPFY